MRSRASVFMTPFGLPAAPGTLAGGRFFFAAGRALPFFGTGLRRAALTAGRALGLPAAFVLDLVTTFDFGLEVGFALDFAGAATGWAAALAAFSRSVPRASTGGRPARGLGAPGTRLEQFRHGRAELRRGFHGAHAGGLQRGELVGRRALAAGHDGAGMAHALAGRGGDTRNVGHHRLGHEAGG